MLANKYKLVDYIVEQNNNNNNYELHDALLIHKEWKWNDLLDLTRKEKDGRANYSANLEIRLLPSLLRLLIITREKIVELLYHWYIVMSIYLALGIAKVISFLVAILFIFEKPSSSSYIKRRSLLTIVIVVNMNLELIFHLHRSIQFRHIFFSIDKRELLFFMATARNVLQ